MRLGGPDLGRSPWLTQRFDNSVWGDSSLRSLDEGKFGLWAAGHLYGAGRRQQEEGLLRETSGWALRPPPGQARRRPREAPEQWEVVSWVKSGPLAPLTSCHYRQEHTPSPVRHLGRNDDSVRLHLSCGAALSEFDLNFKSPSIHLLTRRIF